MNFVQYQPCHGIINKARTNTSPNRKARVHCWRSGGSSELFSPECDQLVIRSKKNQEIIGNLNIQI
jgi:hypothetical protein